MSDCMQCGMWVDPKRPYHPYAACLMFMGCKNGDVVQASLDAVVEYGRQLGSPPSDASKRCKWCDEAEHPTGGFCVALDHDS